LKHKILLLWACRHRLLGALKAPEKLPVLTIDEDDATFERASVLTSFGYLVKPSSAVNSNAP
jgi:hypothetical protein